jgi:hypothetical protein
MSKSFPAQVASVVLRTAPVFHEPSPADARWAELKTYLCDRIDAETPVMTAFHGEITGAASGGMVSACRSALAEMKRLEGTR